jgi:hypothetical protein
MKKPENADCQRTNNPQSAPHATTMSMDEFRALLEADDRIPKRGLTALTAYLEQFEAAEKTKDSQ